MEPIAAPEWAEGRGKRPGEARALVFA